MAIKEEETPVRSAFLHFPLSVSTLVLDDQSSSWWWLPGKTGCPWLRSETQFSNTDLSRFLEFCSHSPCNFACCLYSAWFTCRLCLTSVHTPLPLPMWQSFFFPGYFTHRIDVHLMLEISFLNTVRIMCSIMSSFHVGRYCFTSWGCWGPCSQGAYIPMGQKSINMKVPGNDKCYRGGLISDEWSRKASLMFKLEAGSTQRRQLCV